MCTLKRFINRSGTAQSIAKRHVQEAKPTPERWQRWVISRRWSWIRGVSHAPVNNCSIALQQVMNRIFITLTDFARKEWGLPYLFLCQLCLWAFPGRPPLAVKKHRLSRASPWFKSSLCRWPPVTLIKLVSLLFNVCICKGKKMPTLQGCDGNEVQ